MKKPIFGAIYMLILLLVGCATPPPPTFAPPPTAPLPLSTATSIPATANPTSTTVPTEPATATTAPTRTATLAATPTPTIAHPRVFSLKADAPVLAHSKPPVFPYIYIDPGAVVEHNGKFYMFFNGINGWPIPVQVGLATSDDGMSWTRQGTDPVFKADKLAYVGFTIFASSALVQDDGTWVLYFYSLDNTNFEKGGIGRATAKSPQGPWTADPALVLKPGDAGTWDSFQVSNFLSNLIYHDNIYYLYFDVGRGSAGTDVFMATHQGSLKAN